MSLIEEISNQLRADSKQLIAEVNVIVDKQVTPSWETNTHHFHATLYAYLMAAFSHIDLYSRLWDGDVERSQTKRMRNFLSTYLPRDQNAHAFAVQLWRHTLMHTSRPRSIREKTTGKVYKYLLHWGAPQLPIEQHYVISDFKFSIGLQYLLNDFDQVLDAYLSQLKNTASFQVNAIKVWPLIIEQSIHL